MKKQGYEVIATRPVCVDFKDGRSVSFRPGMRFTASPANASVRRLLQISDLRKLGPREPVPPLPVGFGKPAQTRSILETRRQLGQAKRAAAAKLAASRAAPTQIEVAKPAPKRGSGFSAKKTVSKKKKD